MKKQTKKTRPIIKLYECSSTEEQCIDRLKEYNVCSRQEQEKCKYKGKQITLKLLEIHGFMSDKGTWFLIRCPICNRENYLPAVATGRCVWCGWQA